VKNLLVIIVCITSILFYLYFIGRVSHATIGPDSIEDKILTNEIKKDHIHEKLKKYGPGWEYKYFDYNRLCLLEDI